MMIENQTWVLILFAYWPKCLATVDGRNPVCTTFETTGNHCLMAFAGGIESFQVCTIREPEADFTHAGDFQGRGLVGRPS